MYHTQNIVLLQIHIIRNSLNKNDQQIKREENKSFTVDPHNEKEQLDEFQPSIKFLNPKLDT